MAACRDPWLCPERSSPWPVEPPVAAGATSEALAAPAGVSVRLSRMQGGLAGLGPSGKCRSPPKPCWATAPVLATLAPLRTVPAVIALLAAAETPAPAAGADVLSPFAPLAALGATGPVTGCASGCLNRGRNGRAGDAMTSAAAPGERSAGGRGGALPGGSGEVVHPWSVARTSPRRRRTRSGRQAGTGDCLAGTELTWLARSRRR